VRISFIFLRQNIRWYQVPSPMHKCVGVAQNIFHSRVAPRRGKRTEPGVLTPGMRPKKRPRPERAVDLEADLSRDEPTETVYQKSLPPFQGGRCAGMFPGLKPRAESCSPFGTESSPLIWVSRAPKARLGGQVMKHYTNQAFKSPLVSSGASCWISGGGVFVKE
jgi:hypothetical protein